MGDMGDDFRAMREQRKELREKLGVPCPRCVEFLKKASPAILLPGQLCRVHRYRDPRPREQTPQVDEHK